MKSLDNPDNDIAMVFISGVQVPVFSPRWLLREKIVTAYERQGNRKERTDLDDAGLLLGIVEMSSVDLTSRKEAVQHILNRRPHVRGLLELKIVCPDVIGNAWAWSEGARVYWRTETDQLRYLDSDFERHKFKWDERNGVWYFKLRKQKWFYSAEHQDIFLWS